MTLKADEKAKISPLNRHLYVIHGVMNKGKYDGLLPAACGAIGARRSSRASLASPAPTVASLSR